MVVSKTTKTLDAGSWAFVWMILAASLLLAHEKNTAVQAWMSSSSSSSGFICSGSSIRNTVNPRNSWVGVRRRMAAAGKAGTFFNQVPGESDDDDDDSNSNDDSNNDEPKEDSFDTNVAELLRRRKAPPRASQPSTINGVPTSQAGRGFGAASSSSSSKKKKKQPPPQKFVSTAKKSQPYIGIGPPEPPVNDVTKPQMDDQGFLLYQDEQTGEKSRVFEALVEYPCKFTMKIVGANEGCFVQDMVSLVAESCNVESDKVSHTVRTMGKWTSVTVQAPVESAEMLYQLYETVDLDPRVKFKF